MPLKNSKDSNNLRLGKTLTVSLTVTSNCNLNCKYCYEKHSLRNKEVMDISIAQEAITHFMEKDGFEIVEFDFFGGEPLLGFDFIREVVDWFHTRSWNKKHIFFISTNGTILTDEIRDWLVKNRGCIQVGLSLDGCKTAHDLCRSNSYDRVMENLPFFRKYWHHQPVKMTVCADTIPYLAESVIQMEEMGIFFTANLAFENHWGNEKKKAKLIETYEDQLSLLVDYYEELPHLFPVSPMLTAIPEYLGVPSYGEIDPQKIKRFCGAGHEMVTIDVYGTRYPCHRFIPWVTQRELPKENANCQEAWKPDKCNECKLIHSCPTCAGYNWEINGDTGYRTTFHCDSFKLEVKASCLLEWKRLHIKLKDNPLKPSNDLKQYKIRLKAISEFLRDPILSNYYGE